MKTSESRRSFIRRSTGVAAAFMIPGYVASEAKAGGKMSGSSMQGKGDESLMKVGFAELDVTPEVGMEQPGGYGKAFHRSFHDPCKVRAAVFDDGRKRIAIVAIDALMVHHSLVKSVREKAEARCGIPAESILIGATHSHSSGPTGMIQPGEYDHADEFIRSLAYEKSSCADPRYLDHVEKNLVEVICKADTAREASRVGAGSGMEDKVAFNRRFRMKNGISYTHPRSGNPDIVEVAGPTDPEVGVIGVWNQQGKCTGCLVNYACHATASPGGISANWIYYLEQTIRGTMGADCIVVFLPGPCGDVTQVDNLATRILNSTGEDWSRFVGGRVGAEAVKVLLSMPRGKMSPVDAKTKVIKISRRKPDRERVTKCTEMVKKSPEEVGRTEWTFAKEIVLLDALLKKESSVPVEVQAMQIGPAVFITNPAEFFCQYGLDIKAQSPFKYTFPVELANGCVGYVPTEEAFGPHGGGYETRLTSYSNLETGAGRKMVETGVALAWAMEPGTVPEFPEIPPFNGQPWEYGSVKPEL